MILQKLQKQGLIQPPKFLADNCCFLTIMGSMAYAVSSDSSDMDVYGITIPPREVAFPHLSGEIIGFGTQKQRFETWQQHHIKTLDGHKEYDFQVFSIIKFFQLAMENNPNVIDALFTSRRCILHSTAVGETIREHRKMFLHKGAWPKFKGYAYGQMHKMRNKTGAVNPKRADDIARIGYDSKYAYHIVRLLAEVEQILMEGDLDLERNKEQLKSIRRGDWTLEQIEQYFVDKEKHLEEVYIKSTIPVKQDEEAIKKLLLQCLEHHYGSLDKVIALQPSMELMLQDFRQLLEKYEGNS